MAAKKSARKSAPKGESARMQKVAKSIITTFRQLGVSLKLAANISNSAELRKHLEQAQDHVGKADLALIRLQAKAEG